MTATDTSFRFLQDWQYSDTSATGMKEKDLALLFMVMQHNVFSDTLFRIYDSTLFPSAGNTPVRFVSLKSIDLNTQTVVPGLLIAYEYTLTVCYSGWEPNFQGELVGCAPGPGCDLYHEVQWCESISWTEWYEDGSGGGGGTGVGDNGGDPGGGGSGGGGPGGWNPSPCGGPSGFNARGGGNTSNGNEPCTPGWEPEPIEEEPPSPFIDPCFKLKSLLNDPVSPMKTHILNDLRPNIDTNPNGEIGVRVNRSSAGQTTSTVLSPSPIGQIKFSVGGESYSIAHTHGSNVYPMFSWSDVHTLYQLNANAANHNNGLSSFLLVCKDDAGIYQTYAIVFDAVGSAITSFFNNPENIGCTTQEITNEMDKRLTKYFYEEDSNNSSNYELAFLRSIFGLNVSLFKANTSLNNWTQLTINSNSSTSLVSATECN